ncbi:carbohydrate ABC transporter permease [Paenibacillus sp. S150]|uniref:carbohydrate ABC transporter permease n=1 Tax=Paenibacillus sp. S150 TaxID=2749826 RepID=UPI001C59E27A|nr:sugar ABC transporter permease [Paenibacillus sp. S150]MBW4080160.1 sugar ABC transporter permease [Paenibacillus sp. S150]
MISTMHSKRFVTLALLPALALYAFFVIIPIFWSAYYGLFEWSGVGASTFIGFENFSEALHDPVFWKALKNNLIIVAASILGQVPIALVLAVLLRRNTMLHRFIRSAVFMPMVLSTVVVGLIWGYIYHPQFGLVNYLLQLVGLDSWTRGWLSDPEVNMYAVSVPIIWNFIGPYLIMFIAAIQNIPSEIDDSCQIDGTTPRQKLWLVTLPMIRDTINVVIVMCIAGSLKAFDQVFIMTGGGPAQSTELLATYMYNNTFNIYRYGYGSAVSTLIVIISMAMILVSQLVFKKKDS